MPATVLVRRDVNRTTAAYSVNPTVDRDSTTYTNVGATANQTVTLPKASAGTRGFNYRFLNLVAFTVQFVPTAPDTLLTFNNAAAATVTTPATAGSVVDVECIETKSATTGLARYQWLVLSPNATLVVT
jgi:hypothetical protein